MSPDDNNNNPVGSAEDEKARSTTGRKTSSAVLPTEPLKFPRRYSSDAISLRGGYHIEMDILGTEEIPSRSGTKEISIFSGPEVSDAVLPQYKEINSNATRKDTDHEVMNISPELEKLLRIHTTQFVEKFQAELTGFRIYDSSFNRCKNFIIKQFFKTAQVVDGIKRYDGVTAKEFSELFSRYEPSLLIDCIIRSQMLQEYSSSPMNLTREFSTEYSFIHSSIDQFIEKNINTIGYDQVKLDQYGMPRLRDFITLKFFQMAEESGLMRVMDSTNISDIFRHFEEPLLRDCIQEIQNQGPIQNELIKTFAQPESHEEEKHDQRTRKIKFLQDINLDSAIQGAAVVVGHVFSSSKSRVVLVGMMSALLIGISCSSLAHLLRNKHKSVSKVLTKVGLMGTASTVIIAIAALFPQVMMSCIFGTIAILLLAFMVILN